MKYLVERITVQAEFKQWASDIVTGSQGNSSGSNFSMTVCHPQKDRAWTIDEASFVVIDVRSRLEKLIEADCQAREVPLPTHEDRASKNYKIVTDYYRARVAGDVNRCGDGSHI